MNIEISELMQKQIALEFLSSLDDGVITSCDWNAMCEKTPLLTNIIAKSLISNIAEVRSVLHEKNITKSDFIDSITFGIGLSKIKFDAHHRKHST